MLNRSCKAMTANNHVTYNEAAKRYEMPFGNLLVYANVRRDKNTLYIDYVFAPQELRGKGAAGEFMSTLMDVVRAEKLKPVPICARLMNSIQFCSDGTALPLAVRGSSAQARYTPVRFDWVIASPSAAALSSPAFSRFQYRSDIDFTTY